jgi:hypothetical protein
MQDWDIDTPEGMEAAKRWTAALLERLNEGATWLVPRSSCIYRISNKRKLAVRVMGDDSAITRVLKELGYRVFDN